MDVVVGEGGKGDVFGAEVVDDAAGVEAMSPDPESGFGEGVRCRGRHGGLMGTGWRLKSDVEGLLDIGEVFA